MAFFLKGKNDYSVTVYKAGQRRLFTEYVHNVFNYSRWLDLKAIDWDYIVIYCRRDRQPICYYKKNDLENPFIHAFPDHEKRGYIKSSWQ